VPVLFLTARDDVEDRAAGLNAGAQGYLTKPFSLDDVIGGIRALLT
jgi:two-component system OmpR family response regulator